MNAERSVVKGGLLLGVLTMGITCAAATISVGPGDDLKAKVEAAASGDVVEVAEGTYTIINEVTVPGGVTVTGAGIGKTFVTSTYNQERYMTISAGATVEGFTFSGRQISSRSLHGKAVQVLGTLRNSRVTGFSNGAHFMNGAVWVNADEAVVEDCEIDNNLTGQDYSGNTPGGGVYLQKGLVKNCYIHHNEAHRGSGVHMTGGTLESCVIVRNKIRLHSQFAGKPEDLTGTGVSAEGGTIRDCVITANEALTHFGIGGLYVKGNTAVVCDTIVRGNVSYSSASAGFPDFHCLDAAEEANFSGCSLPIAYGADCNTKPVLFKDAAADDFTVVNGFSVDRTSALVGDELTFEAAEPGDWTFTDAQGATISETGKAKVVRSFPAGVYDVAYTAGGVTHEAKSAFGIGEVSYEVSTAEEFEEAVALARDGATITVAAGTYPLTKCVWLLNAVTVVGAGRDVCTLTGTFADRMLVVANKGASVRGLTVSGGNLKAYGFGGGKEGIDGSGVLINERGGTITDCRLTGAKAGWHYQLGAVAVQSADGWISHCIIDNNDMSYGDTCWCGGLYVGAGLAENCLIAGSKSNEGGAVGVGAKGLVRNCTIVDNTVKKNCAGACVVAKGGSFVNCLVGPNAGGTEWTGDAAAFTACAFVETDPPSEASFRVALPYVNRAEGDYMIQGGENGPADRGTSYEGVAETDLGGNARVQGAAIDIGCYEADAERMTCQFTVVTSSGFADDSFEFTCEVNNAPAGTTLTYAWTFDNGADEPLVSADASPVMTLGPGVYTVNLTVTAGAKQAVAPTQANAVKVGVRDLYAEAEGGAGEFPYDAPGKGTSDITTLAALVLDGSTIHLGAGDYTLTDELVLDKAVTLTGAGRDATCLHQSKAGVRVLTLDNAGAVCENLSVTDGKLTARKDQGTFDSWGIAVKIGTNGGTVRNCRIFGNTEGNHFEYGAIAVLGEAGHVDRCLIDGNKNLFQTSSGDGYGAGVYVKAGLVENCMITNNYAFTGGGAYVEGGLLRNCTIFANSALRAGGVYAKGSGIVRNCVLSGDTSTASDSYAGAPEWGETAACFDTCAFDGLAAAKIPGTTSFAVASPFEDPAGGNLTPLSGETGLADRAAPYDEAETQSDFLGNPRVSGKGLDIGCIELDANRFACSYSVDLTEGFNDRTYQFTAGVVNPPAGATLAYVWTITDRFGNVLAPTEANPALDLAAGWYSVGLRVYDVGNPSVAVTAPTVADYVHVAVRDSYATVGNDAAAYPYDTAEKGSTNLCELVAEAIDGTTIHVGAGVLTNVDEIVITKGITLCGEGAGASTLAAAAKQRVLTINHKDAVVENLSLTGGRSTVRDGRGGGVLISFNGGTLRDCRVYDNVGANYYQHGGGVSVEGADGLVDRCVIDGNVNTYREQIAYGGGVYATAGTVRNSLIVGNTANHGGGVVTKSNAVIENCTIIGNSVVLTSNNAGGHGGGIVFVNFSNESTVRNCVFWNNAGVVEDHDGGYEWFVENWAGIPKFEKTAFPKRAIHEKTLGTDCLGLDDPGFADAAKGDYRLTIASPLRNAGKTADWQTGATDLDGQRRVWGKGVDIGCYELQYGYGIMLFVR